MYGCGMPTAASCCRVFAGHHDFLPGLAFSPDDKTILTTSNDSNACFWDVGKGQLIRCIQPGVMLAFNAAFSPDGRYALAGGLDGVARLWEVSTGQEIHRYTQSQVLGGVAFSPDGKTIATASFDGTACIWATEASMVQKEFSIPGFGIMGIGFSPDGRNILAGGIGDVTARMWDVNNGQETGSFTMQSEGANAAPDGRVFFFTTGLMFTWDAMKGIGFTPLKFTLPNKGINGIDVSSDGKMVVVADSSLHAYLFDAVSGEFLEQFPGNGYCQTTAFSPDGSRLALGSSITSVKGIAGQTWIFSVPGLEKLRELDYPTDNCFTAMAFSTDGRSILSAGYGGNYDLILWDAVTGAKLQQFTTYSRFIQGVALSPDGRYAAAGGADNIARIWEITTGQEVRRFVGHEGVISSMKFSPDGKWLATGSYDSTVKLWYTDLEDLKTAMCAALPRNLTPEERANYGIAGDEPTCPKFGQVGSGTP